MTEKEIKETVNDYIFDDLVLLPDGGAVLYSSFYNIFKSARNLEEMVVINQTEKRGYESILKV